MVSLVFKSGCWFATVPYHSILRQENNSYIILIIHEERAVQAIKSCILPQYNQLTLRRTLLGPVSIGVYLIESSRKGLKNFGHQLKAFVLAWYPPYKEEGKEIEKYRDQLLVFVLARCPPQRGNRKMRNRSLLNTNLAPVMEGSKYQPFAKGGCPNRDS